MDTSKGEEIIIKWLEPYTKHIVIIILLIISFIFGNVTYEKYICENACNKEGYFSSRYKPAGRAGNSACFCLSEKEAKNKNKIPMGKQINCY